MTTVSLGAIKSALLDPCSNGHFPAEAVGRFGGSVDVSDGVPDGERAELVTGEILRLGCGHTAGPRDPDQPFLSRPRERRLSHAC